MLTTLCWCVCKILFKWMSINFCFSSWSHCKCHMQSTQGVDLPGDVPVLALERGSAIARHQNVGAQQKCLLLCSLVLIFTDRVWGPRVCGRHPFNIWMLVMHCVGWGPCHTLVYAWGIFAAARHSPHSKGHAEQTALGSGLLHPILAWSQVSCVQGHSLTLNTKN